MLSCQTPSVHFLLLLELSCVEMCAFGKERLICRRSDESKVEPDCDILVPLLPAAAWRLLLDLLQRDTGFRHAIVPRFRTCGYVTLHVFRKLLHVLLGKPCDGVQEYDSDEKTHQHVSACTYAHARLLAVLRTPTASVQRACVSFARCDE